MIQLLAIAAGGALGSMMRFLMSTWVYSMLGRGFPYGTLAVNIIGSLVMGLLTVLLVERMSLGPEWRAAILIGLLGGFTTFSSFSIETFNLIEAGAYVKAITNMVVSVLVCVSATWVGVILGRQL